MNHSELSHMAGAVDDSTINIVVVVIIIIIISVSDFDGGAKMSRVQSVTQSVLGLIHHSASLLRSG